MEYAGARCSNLRLLILALEDQVACGGSGWAWGGGAGYRGAESLIAGCGAIGIWERRLWLEVEQTIIRS